MKEEYYYIVPKELMDKLMGELGSYAYINNCFTEMDGLNQQLTSTPLIDLSDEAIDTLSEKYADTQQSCWANDYGGYYQALTDIKQQIK